MDVQRKKGILEVCVLAVLKRGPSYGYLIIRELERCIEISESTLYPILKRLEQNGSLKTYRQEYNGRMRKYYQLTEEGQYKIDQFLDEWDELQNMYRFVEEWNACVPAEETGEPAEADRAPETAAADEAGEVSSDEAAAADIAEEISSDEAAAADATEKAAAGGMQEDAPQEETHETSNTEPPQSEVREAELSGEWNTEKRSEEGAGL